MVRRLFVALLAAFSLIVGFTVSTASIASADPVQASPDAPTSLVAYRGDGSAEISFTAGADNGASITNYKYSTDNGSSWTAFSPVVTSSSVTIGGLTNGITYSVKLRAVNSVGDGAVSDAVSVTPAVVDAVTWTARSASEANNWFSVTYGNGVFVAVASDGTNRVMTSTDGVTWTARTAAAANSWRSVVYGNGVFVAVAGSGSNRVMTSTDGVTWTTRTATEVSTWNSVVYGNGVFVAVASTGTIRVMTSTDGVTWTARTAAAANLWTSVTYGSGIFVAVASSGTNRVMTSTDGMTWTPRAAEATYWTSVTFGNGVFVAVANFGTNRVMTSTDGETWTARTATEANSWRSVTYGNGVFVAVANFGTNRVMTSTNGETWTARTATEANSWNSVVYGNGVFAAVAGNGTNRVMTSSLVALATAPAAPTSLLATPGNGSASIAFTAGADGGSAITKYQYQLGSGSWTDAVGTTSPVSISGLTNGTDYSIKLRAVNTAGDGAASDAVSVTPRTVPGAPSITSVTPGDSTVSVAFTAGATGGSLITDYEYQLNGSGSWFSLGTTSSPASIGVTNGLDYTVKLRAVNVAGLGAASSASGSFTPAAAPSAPTGLNATPGDGSASIAFTPGADGGSAITKYQYKVGTGAWTDAVGTTSPIAISGLTNNVVAAIRLRAVNSAGDGAVSAVVKVWPRIAGSALSSLKAQTASRILASVAALNPVGGTVSHYWFTAYAKGTSTVVTTCRATAAVRSCVFSGLLADTEYDVSARGFFTLTGSADVLQTLDSATQTVRTKN